MQTKSLQEREVFWREQLEAGRNRTGSLAVFCRERGLSISSYENWRRRLEGKKERARKPASVFLPVRVGVPARQKNKTGVIDPRWLAEFVWHLHRGVDESGE